MMKGVASFVLICIAVVYGSYDYCRAPSTTGSVDIEGLTLAAVQVVFRHGDRTPTVPLPTWPATWDCSPDFLLDHSYNRDAVLPAPARLHRLVMMPGREDLKGNCALGQLTAKGYQMHLTLGNEFKNLYIDQYKLLNPNFDASEVWVRSSNVPRTIQSLMGNLRGMFPPTPHGQSVDVIDIHTMDNDFEDLWANPKLCPRIEQYEKELVNAPEYKQELAKLDTLYDKLKTVFNSSIPPAYNNLFDNLWARQCHSLKFPPGLTYENTLAPITDFINWYARYTWMNPLYAQLTFSPLLSEIVEKFENFVQNTTKTHKYVAYSAHDTTVGPLGAFVGAFDGLWPPYASHITMELWKNETNGEMFMQTKYNGVVSTSVVPGAGTMVPYGEWIKKMKSILPTDYQKLCQVQ